MAIRTIEQSQAFSPGSDLWVIPQNCITPLVRKIDWYMNFQISRSQGHKSEVLAPQLIQIINENALPNFTPEKVSPNTLLVARQNLPAQWLVTAESSKNKTAWAKNIHSLWKKMGRPHTRVFLSEEISASDFEHSWPEKEINAIEVVPAH